MAKIGFEFPRDNSQQWDGFNEPGMEHFAGSPFRSLGREGTQNALDAAIGSPVAVSVRLIEVPTASIPDLDQLRSTLKLCATESQAEGEKAKQFFDTAMDLLGKSKISILQFSDSNTSGVKGPCELGSPYFALMKATGQSKKESGTATGSFGIGKFAPFTVSGLRTIFLSTLWSDESGAMHHYVQGKAILMSHRNGSATHRGTGFWGITKNCQPLVGNLDELPDWLHRQGDGPGNTGTTLSILGFVPTKGWEKILAASIGESFFGAVCRGQLTLTIEGGPTLSAGTLPSFFADKDTLDAIKDQKEEPETFQNSGHFLRALSSTESKVEETQNASLGHCRLHILVGEGLPKRVAVLRNGMLITSELTRLRRFGEFKEFVAVLECLSDKGNALLRAMEPPPHNDFEPDRLPTPQQQRAGRVALRELAEWVRQMLQRHAQDPVAEVSEIDELAEFFGDDEEGSGPKDKNGDENPRGALKIRARPLPKKKSTTSDTHDDATQEAGDTDSGGDGDDTGDSGGDGGGSGGYGGKNESTGGDATKAAQATGALQRTRSPRSPCKTSARLFCLPREDEFLSLPKLRVR
ncbi:hypothetical protein [Mesorhizobium sp.]|uniref:hypothetical protein n=1 Tax=Mesorhizobium sp. TaxID=1871066 RepID=UPI000FE5C369|nr:hypothetical protein [Mesorhizobium sp.]RWI04340.1 MAG: hypothetical protein EOQ90_30685 [Mesorhizobium sp.]RWM87930.1 MAG: hypothetical protein EOR83_00060 [Mesorhizobium sp.]